MKKRSGQFPCFNENISKSLPVKRHSGTYSTELTNLAMMKEEQKATREKFKVIKYVLDQTIHWVEKWHYQ